MTPEVHERGAATQRAKTDARLASHIAEMRLWLAHGVTREEICARLQCSRQTLRHFLHEHEIV